MNVIISNRQEELLAGLNIEVIKALRGEFDTDELIGTFSNFFFARMILDLSALKNSEDIVTYQRLSIGLPVDKIILLIPSDSKAASSQFISKLISLGYYNFTTNAEGVQYLLTNPNTYKDVAHLHIVEAAALPPIVDASGNVTSSSGSRIIGIKNLTDNAGATSLIYMLKKELEQYGMEVLTIEITKRDFIYYNDKTMVSSNKATIASELLKARNASVILIDLNDGEENMCDEVIYLIEASVIKLNKLMFKDRSIFGKIRGKKIILNKCVLTKEDCVSFEEEAGLNFFYILPPINDRERNDYIGKLASQMGLINTGSNTSKPHKGGLFGGMFG